jgi:hypothetical protein
LGPDSETAEEHAETTPMAQRTTTTRSISDSNFEEDALALFRSQVQDDDYTSQMRREPLLTKEFFFHAAVDSHGSDRNLPFTNSTDAFQFEAE